METAYTTLAEVIATLPADKRADVYKIAHSLNLREGAGDELIFSILVGLGYHATLLCGVPDEILKSGDAIATKLDKEFTDNAIKIVNAGKAAATAVDKALGDGAAAVQLAAQQGATIAIKEADLTVLLDKIERAQNKASARKWFGRAAVTVSIVVVIIAIISFVAGWYLRVATYKPPPIPPIPDNYVTADMYLGQLKCDAKLKADKTFSCTDTFGGKITFRGLEFKK